MKTMNHRRRYWAYALGWIGIIYSTLYIVRPICTLLKKTIPFAPLVNITCIILLIILLGFLWKKAKPFTWLSYFILAVVTFSYIYGLVTIQYPEEKIHFIEYGILSFLVFRAIRIDFPKKVTFLLSFVLVSILGWIDESIQYLLPNRYYQIEDVILNSVSGFLGLLIVQLFEKNNS